MSDVIIKFSQIGADGVQRAFEAQNVAIDQQSKLMRDAFNATVKADTGMKQFGASGVKTMDLLRDGVRDMVSDLAGIRLPSFSGGMGGFLLESAGTALDIAKQEEQRKRAMQEASRVAALGAAERRREVIMNLPDDEHVNAGNVDSVMQGISSRTGTEFNKVQGAMVPTMSATGALSNDFAAKALERGFTRMPNNEQFAVDYSGRLLDLMNIEHGAGRSTDDNKFDQLEGALLSTQAASRVKSQSKMAQTAVPLAKAMSQTGDSTERSFEYFAAMSNLLADEQGDKSRTAMASLAGHLADTQRNLPKLGAKDSKGRSKLDGVPESDLAAFANATNTDERLAALHKSPSLFKALDQADQFQFGEADTKGILRGMLSGDSKVMGQLDAAAGKVKWGDEATAFLTRKMDDLSAGKQQGVLSAEQGSTAAVEEFSLTKSLSARNAAMRKLASDANDKSSRSFIQRQMSSLTQWAGWDADRPEFSAQQQISEQAADARNRLRGATSESDVEAVTAELQLLERFAKLINESAIKNKAPNDLVNVPVPGGQDIQRPMSEVVKLLEEQNRLIREQGSSVERPPSAPVSLDLANGGR